MTETTRAPWRCWQVGFVAWLIVCSAALSQADLNVVVSNTGEVERMAADENQNQSNLQRETISNETVVPQTPDKQASFLQEEEYDDVDDEDDENGSEEESNDQYDEDNAFEDDDDDDDEWDSPMYSNDDSDSEFAAEAETPNPPDVDEGSDLGEPQKYYRKYIDQTTNRIQAARTYIQDKVKVDPFYTPVKDICVNKDKECAIWAILGECEKNSAYMKLNCAPVCESCEMMHVQTRCPPPDPNGKMALYPGDLDRMFRRLLADPAFAQYTPKALSRPDLAEGDTPETADYQLGMWLVILENIVNEEEANRMIELAHLRGYERSEDVGEEKEDGTFGGEVNDDRTSTNAWCEGECYEDPVPQKVMKTIEHVTGIPEPNQESLQQLKYEVGQFYNVHNDFIDYQVDRPGGPRILTFFLYLNDVEEGGETRFPRIGLSVKPKLGRAVLWPSVHDYDLNLNDLRSDHQALPVLKGVKFGANAWIHQNDVKNDPLDCM